MPEDYKTSVMGSRGFTRRAQPTLAMKRTLHVLPDAEAELQSAAIWCEEKRAGLGVWPRSARAQFRWEGWTSQGRMFSLRAESWTARATNGAALSYNAILVFLTIRTGKVQAPCSRLVAVTP
jgi:hypothetical protein